MSDMGIGGINPALILNTLQDLVRATNAQAQVIKGNLGTAASGDLSGIYPGPISVVATHLASPLPIAQGGTGTTTGVPACAASGDLAGNYPNPTVARINGVALGSTIATAGNLLIGSGTQWVTHAVSGDVSLTAAGVATVARINGVALGTTTATAGNLLVGSGVQWATLPLSGDATLTSGGVLTIANGAVSNAKLVNSAITLNAGANVGLTVPGALNLGGTGVIGNTNDTPRFSGLGLGGAAAGPSTIKLYGTGSGAIIVAVPAAAGANTQTLPAQTGTMVVAGQTQATSGMFATPFGLTDFHNLDGSVLSAAASAGKFGFSITLGTSAGLVGEAAQGNTKTSDALVEAILPPWYVAASNIAVTVNAKLTGAGVAGTHTAQIKAWRTAVDGSQGADLGPGVASNITAG